MITIKSLTKAYGDHTVLDGASADFQKGRVSYLLGPNGAGKTTLFKCLLGLEAHSGTVEFSGRRLADVRERVFPIFDDCPLYPHLSGFENLRLLTGHTVDWDDVRAVADGALDRASLRKPARALSYGQRKKLYTVGLLIVRPAYIILDELANGLDYDSLQWLRTSIEQLKQTGVVVASGHQFDFYDKVADDVFAVSEKRLSRIDFNHGDGDNLEAAYLRHRGNHPQ
ncbi:ATP-binding cassette domain-containing protein [Streptomyces sp. NPDC059452]|uniref:ATP-binding cassette domain-containing protein n=1 Tax=Streptomyces sp. NPDC059452 TaxID=3346835 RepID=UPI0036933718